MKEKKISHVEDYFSTRATKFVYLLKKTRKWKEFYNQAESKLSIVISVLFTVLLHYVYKKTQFEGFNELLIQVVQLLIGAASGMLGFIISGLAIFTGTITSKLVDNIESDEKIDGLVGILFSFFFIGAIIGGSIFIYLVSYILLLSDLVFDATFFSVMTLFTSYLFSFSVLYSVSLLGTCIRLFFVSYKYSKEKK